MTTDSILLKALALQRTERVPVWLMRQAGRYLPEYRKIREQVGDFLKLCKTPEHAVELSMQPIRRYDLDAAIIFSDILVVPEAMGMELSFVTGKGPVFTNPLGQEMPLQKLKTIEPEQDLRYVMDAIRGLRTELPAKTPVIGFSGSPWTLAVYMLQGHGDGQFTEARKILHQQPGKLQQLIELLVNAIAEYLTAQHNAGADVLMIFDTWGCLLGTDTWQQYSMNPIKKIIEKLPGDCPVIVFGKGTGTSTKLEQLATSGCAAIGIDWTVDMATACDKAGNRVALQGNMDPAVLLTDHATIKREVKRTLRQAETASGHIFNTGHGIMPQVPPGNVAVLVDAVREYSVKL